jgi:hypothetical protein
LATIATHEKRCSKRPMTCVECGASFPTDEGKAHWEVCPCRIEECDNCREDFCFRDLADHKANECDMKLIPCSIFQEFNVCVPGCVGVVNKGLVSKHLGNNAKLIQTMHARYKQQKVVMSVSFVFTSSTK